MRLLCVASLATLALLVPAGGAAAAVTCTFAGSTATVTLGAVGDVVRFSKLGNSDLRVQAGNAGVDVPCAGGPANMADAGNLDTVVVNDASAGNTQAILDLTGGQLGPGTTSEGMFNVGEVEFDIDLGSGTFDILGLFGTSGDDTVDIGLDGASPALNPNAGFDGLIADADVTLDGVEVPFFSALGGNDTLRADGAAAPFDAPFDMSPQFFGEAGNDTLVGGTGSDTLEGGAGDDTITAGPAGDVGPNTMRPGIGDDVVNGSGGVLDSLQFFDGAILSGITVDLADAAQQDTEGAGLDTISGVEFLFGSQFDDVLRGTDTANIIFGEGGADVIEGRGGGDTLHGNDGGAPDADTDTLSYESAAAGVTVDLGDVAAQDTVGAGSDTVGDFQDLTGSAFADSLTGTTGANLINGGGGSDTIAALAGNDDVRVRDGGADTADCGDGSDSAESDQQGTDTLTSCESVAFTPTPAPPSPPAPPAPPGGDPGPAPAAGPDGVLELSLGGRRAQRVLRQRAVVVTARCPAEACTITATGRIAARRLSLRPRSARASLAAGERRTLRLRLTRRQLARVRAALRRGRRVRARVAVGAIDATGTPVTKRRSITLR